MTVWQITNSSTHIGPFSNGSIYLSVITLYAVVDGLLNDDECQVHVDHYKTPSTNKHCIHDYLKILCLAHLGFYARMLNAVKRQVQGYDMQISRKS